MNRPADISELFSLHYLPKEEIQTFTDGYFYFKRGAAAGQPFSARLSKREDKGWEQVLQSFWNVNVCLKGGAFLIDYLEKREIKAKLLFLAVNRFTERVSEGNVFTFKNGGLKITYFNIFEQDVRNMLKKSAGFL